MIGFTRNDGGRADAGYRGEARDCVARALSIFPRKASPQARTTRQPTPTWLTHLPQTVVREARGTAYSGRSGRTSSRQAA